LAEIGSAVGVSPVYLTQVFRQVEVCRFIVINSNCGSPGRLTYLMFVQI
jgi:hypothetical protein